MVLKVGDRVSAKNVPVKGTIRAKGEGAYAVQVRWDDGEWGWCDTRDLKKEEQPEPKPYKITPEELVHSRTAEEIREKLQQVFGKYEDLERMDRGEIPLTVEGDVSKDYMADIEHAAVGRDLPETKELLRRAYDEIAEGYTKGILPAYRPSLVAELAEEWEKKQALQKGRVPNHKTIAELDRKYTFNELKNMCKEKGLPISGDKKALIRRLFFGD